MQGAFLDSEAVNKSSSNLSADELLELLNTDKTFQDKAQSGVVSDKVPLLAFQTCTLQQFHIIAIIPTHNAQLTPFEGCTQICYSFCA